MYSLDDFMAVLRNDRNLDLTDFKAVSFYNEYLKTGIEPCPLQFGARCRSFDQIKPKYDTEETICGVCCEYKENKCMLGFIKNYKNALKEGNGVDD